MTSTQIPQQRTDQDSLAELSRLVEFMQELVFQGAIDNDTEQPSAQSWPDDNYPYTAEQLRDNTGLNINGFALADAINAAAAHLARA